MAQSRLDAIKTAWRKITGLKPTGHGPFHEGINGWVDPKPYTEVRSNGIFEGYDGALWMYFGFPDDVKIEWTKNPDEIIYNQHFFVDIANDLAQQLSNQTERTRRDNRRKFHMPLSLDLQNEIRPYPGVTPAHMDYLRRMSSQYTKPVWNGYLGFKLTPQSAFHEAYGVKAMTERWIQVLKDPEALNFHLYRADIQYVQELMLSYGFRPLDFSSVNGRDDYERLTAWHGQYDDNYGLNLQLESTVSQEPVHGMSMITPRWGELTFHSIRPKEEMFMTDPAAENSRWAKPIFRPGSDVVMINIRGEIRSPKVAENFLDSKRLIGLERATNNAGSSSISISDREEEARKVSNLDRARGAVSAGHSLLDNVEITVAHRVREENKHQLNNYLSGYNLQAVPLIGRQPTALNSTFPTYPLPLVPIKSGNKTRSKMTNAMLPGVLAMSGVFRKTKPAANGGILVGLSESGFEFEEIYTGIESAAKHHGSPGMLITGRPGAGKTQEMLQLLAQAVYDNRSAVFLNFKPTGSLQAFFDNAVDGITVNMGNKFLEDNPGMLDPVIFFSDRKRVASILSSAIVKVAGLDKGSTTDQMGVNAKQGRLAANLTDNATDLRNQCSYDIIFGNEQKGTTGITDEDIRDLVSNRIASAPFWKAFIAQDPMITRSSEMREKFESGAPLLVEWDKTLSMPEQSDVEKGNLQPQQIDSLLSASILFEYSVELIGEQNIGGMVAADESWVLRASTETKKLIESAGRTWREANIMLVLGTQRIRDWIDPDSKDEDLSTFFNRYIIMAISQDDKKEHEAFFRLTGLPSTGAAGRRNLRFIIEAGARTEKDRDGKTRKNKEIPRAYYIDRLEEFEGGIVCGPWPERELNAGRTDKSGVEARRRGDEEDEEAEKSDDLLMRIVNEDTQVLDFEDDMKAENVEHSR